MAAKRPKLAVVKLASCDGCQLTLLDCEDELLALSERELKRTGEFVVPGLCKLTVQRRKARDGRNPATGEVIKIPAKIAVKAKIAKPLKDAVLPRK